MLQIFRGSNSAGFMFLELLIAIALVSIVFVTLLGIGAYSLNLSASLKTKSQGDALVQQELEAVRSFRDGSTWGTNGLGSLAAGSADPYCPEQSGGSWTLVAGTCAAQNGFTQSVTINRVSRDPSTGNIETTYNAADDDANTREVIASVASPTFTDTIIAYFTNWNGQ